MKKSDIGLIGLAVMGENLALNMESKGYTVSLYNRMHPDRPSVVDRFLSDRGKNKSFVATYSPDKFVESLSRPRKIMLMVKAGAPVDEVIGQLIPYLSEGDVIIDGGNSDYHDTERRVKDLERKGFLFVGTGVSGGEEGALRGPSIMPGGSPEAWPLVKDILQSIAAKLEDGTPCCQWMGKGGAGHFVKMVHNGIEYGDMELIAETYALLKQRLGLDNPAIADIFGQWNREELDSFLIEITSHIFRYQDENGRYLIDDILDVAGQKGTGKWSAITALDESNPLTLITESVYARFLSSMFDVRQKAASLYPEIAVQKPDDLAKMVGALKDALYASKLISYAQGFSLLKSASEHYGWDLDYGTIAMIWRKGCIIRSVFLGKITEAYQRDPKLENLLFDVYFADKIKSVLPQWRQVVADGALSGIALPCISSALSYFDGLRTKRSTANLIQAQRDYFGAHTYERTDTERGLFFHTNWTGKGGKTLSGSYNA